MIRRYEEVKKEVIEKKIEPLKKKVSIIFDGKQYSIRILRAFAEKAEIDPKSDEFEFELKMPEPEEKGEYLPELRGELVEKEKKGSKG